MLLYYLKALFYICLITIIYGFIYSQLPKEAFEFKDPLLDPYYFSMTTISTIGYGDNAPKTRMAKIIVISQMMLIATGFISWFHNE